MYPLSCQSFPLGSLTLWFMTILAVASGQCSNCGDIQFYNIPVTPVMIPLITGSSASPFYGVIETNITINRDIDNICTTFFQITTTKFIFARSYVYSNGSYRIELYVVRDIPGRLGAFRSEGFDYCSSSTLVYEEQVLGIGCPISFALTKNYLYGSCSKVSQQEGKQIRYALAAHRKLPKVCVDLLKAVCNSQPQIGVLDFDTGFIELPKKLNYRCLTKLNKASCIGADRVPKKDSVSLPCCNCFS